MARISSTNTKDKSESVAIVATEEVTKAPKNKDANRKKKESKADAAPVVEETVASAASAATVATESVATEAVVDDVAAAAAADSAELAKSSTDFFVKLATLSATIASLRSEYRSLEKRWSKEIKVAQKSQSKRKRKSGNKQPDGFVKPSPISAELAAFLNLPAGSEMPRVEVTRAINSYVKENNLQLPSNKRTIVADGKLKSLLKLSDNDVLTYFNMQRFLSHHFPETAKAKAAKAAKAASTSAAK